MRKLVIALLLVLTGSLVMAQDAPAISPELQTQIDSLEKVTTEIRGLEPLEKMDLLFPTHDELRAFLKNEMDTSLDEETLNQAMAFYTAFDFLSPDINLRDIVFNLYEQQIAGFYDPATKKMNVILISGKPLAESLPLLERIIFVHEYTHALQDQHFDLKTYLDESNASSNDAIGGDRTLARQSLVEGDATYVMTEYTVRATQEDPAGALVELLQSGLNAGSISLPAGTPQILGAELLFPYEAGQNLVNALILDGGWDRVNEAFSHPPETTEQVMHPEKFIAGEKAIAVTLPEDADFPGDGWTSVQVDTLGEFYLQQYLHTLLDLKDASTAAAGWGGDQYELYRNDVTGDIAWRLKIVWDTPADRNEFKTAFEEFLAERTGSTAKDSCHVSTELRVCADYSGDDNSVMITSMPVPEMAQG